MAGRQKRARRATADEQEQFWDLSIRYGRALTAERQALLRYNDAKAALDHFNMEHVDVTFLVFRPEDIDRAFDDTIRREG